MVDTHGGLFDGQNHDKSGSLVLVAFYRDDTVVGIDDFFDNSQADTGALRTIALVQSLEYLKYLVREFLIKANTVVLKDDAAELAVVILRRRK